MSKSLGNFYTLKDLEEKFEKTPKNILYRALRIGFINGKYKDSIEFNFDKLEANFNTIENIDNTFKSMKRYLEKTSPQPSPLGGEGEATEKEK